MFGSIIISKAFSRPWADAPKPFCAQSQAKGASELDLDPVPSAPQAAICDRGWKGGGTHQSSRPGRGSRQGKWLEGQRPGRGAHWLLAGARSQLPARAVVSQIAGGGAHLGTSGLRCSRSSPSSVVPRPMLGGCGLGCELDEISSGRGSAAEINRRVWPPAGPRGPRNPNSMLLGDTPKSRAKGSATSDPATPRLPASHYLTLAGLQHDRKLLYEASASGPFPPIGSGTCQLPLSQ